MSEKISVEKKVLSENDLSRVKENARSINADLKIFEVSCRTGQGLEAWYEWIKSLAKKVD
jgi:Ni2+-binding GTPase involved in maturation of urease and hydrogenase